MNPYFPEGSKVKFTDIIKTKLVLSGKVIDVFKGLPKPIIGCDSWSGSEQELQDDVRQHKNSTIVLLDEQSVKNLEDAWPNHDVGFLPYCGFTPSAAVAYDLQKANDKTEDLPETINPTANNTCPSCGGRGEWVNGAMKCPDCWRTWM